MSVEWIAHRGASAEAPENTLAAIRLAWEQGADAVEIDVHLSRDGHVVAIHDATTRRTAALERPVCGQTLAELKSLDAGSWKDIRWIGEKIPTLSEVLAILPSDKRLFIELKSGPQTVPVLCETLRRSSCLPNQIAVIGFSLSTLRFARRIFGESNWGDCSFEWCWEIRSPAGDSNAWRAKAERCLNIARRAGITGLDLCADVAINAEFVERVHAAGMWLDVWTVDDESLAKQMIAAGVDGITTNRPDSLRAACT